MNHGFLRDAGHECDAPRGGPPFDGFRTSKTAIATPAAMGSTTADGCSDSESKGGYIDEGMQGDAPFTCDPDLGAEPKRNVLAVVAHPCSV